MITAVDTNIVLDLALPGAEFQQASQAALGAALASGPAVVSGEVFAELAGRFPDGSYLDAFLAALHIDFVPTTKEALHSAGQAWAQYNRSRPANLTCPRCGHVQQVTCPNCGSSLRPRQHVLADFLIGAHAVHHGGRLLTRDRGFYQAYFPSLTVLTP